MRVLHPILFSILLLWPATNWSIGYIYTNIGRGTRELLELSTADVQIDIRDRLAITRTIQVFTNHADRQVEGIYEFALPHGAIITDLVLWINGEPIKGIIIEKEQARQAYEEIVGRLTDPALIEQVKPNFFRLSIFPFPPGGSRKVELEYSQILAEQDGNLHYTFPMAPEGNQSLLLERFTLNAQIASQQPVEVTAGAAFSQLASIDSPTPFAAHAFWSGEQVVPADDFELHIIAKSPQRLPTLLSYPPMDGIPGYYTLWLPPMTAAQLQPTDPLIRTVIFAVDISSSMLGLKLQRVKKALATALDNLQPHESFNIIAFNDRTHHFTGQPVAANRANKRAALNFIQSRHALGLTNLEKALDAALDQTFHPEHSNRILLLSDGHHSAGEASLLALSNLTETAPPEIGIFAIGVEGDVNRALLRSLTEISGGWSEFAAETDEFDLALERLLQEFALPSPRPAGLDFAEVSLSEVYPTNLGPLSEGNELFQVGRYTSGGPVTLEIKAIDGGLIATYPLNLAESDTSLGLVPRIWANQKIQHIENQISLYGPQAELLDGILVLGLDYRLVTRMTSLFAPDPSVEVNPDIDEDNVDSAVEAETATASWLDKTFYLRDGVWIDVAYDPAMPLQVYTGAADQPQLLYQFAQLAQAMIVVVEKEAYRLDAGATPARPILAQNFPNPFNASTHFRFYLPASMADQPLHLAIYNLLGQELRVLKPAQLQIGENSLAWDGRDQNGRSLASGIYIYRLQGTNIAINRRLMILR